MNGYELLTNTALIKDLRHISVDLLKHLYYIQNSNEKDVLKSIFDNRLSLNCRWKFFSAIGAKPEAVVFEIDYEYMESTPKIFNIEYYPEAKWYLNIPINFVDRSFYNNHTILSFSEDDNNLIQKVKSFIESIKCKDFELYISYKLIYEKTQIDNLNGIYEWIFAYRDSLGHFRKYTVSSHDKEDFLEFIDIKLMDKYPINIFSNSFYKLTDDEITLLECYCI